MAIKKKNKKPKFDFNDISGYLQNLRNMEMKDIEEGTFNLVLGGEHGVGKTSIAMTARKPVLIHSFDPGGTELGGEFKKMKAKGDILVEKFETDFSKEPEAFDKWEAIFLELKRMNAFQDIGTYMVDSFTTWNLALMNQLSKQLGRSDGKLEWEDYANLKPIVIDYIKMFGALDCDFILPCHLRMVEDKVSGKNKIKIDAPQSLQNIIPSLFSEFYYMDIVPDGSKIKRILITGPQQQFRCRTRLGAGVFDTREKPDIKYLLNKAGLVNEDKHNPTIDNSNNKSE